MKDESSMTGMKEKKRKSVTFKTQMLYVLRTFVLELVYVFISILTCDASTT